MATEPKKRRSRIRERNEILIIKAAEAIFAQRGFGAATTAEISQTAGIPKANLHYYFNTKEDLYIRVLENILKTWLVAAEDFNETQDPATALKKYIEEKIELSRISPHSSKIFAKEIISGAPFLEKHLRKEINPWINEKAKICENWIAQGKMQAVDVRHLFFLIWSMTQTYADFSSQMTIVLDKEKLDQADYDAGAKLITQMVFSVCGLK